MTLKDIVNTPIDELWDKFWNVASPFIMGASIAYLIIFIIVVIFIGYTAKEVFTSHRNFKKKYK